MIANTRAENLRVLRAMRCEKMTANKPAAILIHDRGPRSRPP